MKTKLEKWAQVDKWLDMVIRLPLGHPDRLRFLTYAEQILEGSAPAGHSVISLAGSTLGAAASTTTPVTVSSEY
jgi:hypothetical protein